MKNNKAFAEVIESSLNSFLAQCWCWDNFPRFGSLVCVEEKEKTFFGCVTDIKTGSMDPLRYPFPYKKTEEELRVEQPQIFEFLKTTFTVVLLGYKENFDISGKIIYRLPPTPAKIHAFVEKTIPSFSADFFSETDFLYLLFSSQNIIPQFDELLLEIFSQLAVNKKLTTQTVNTFSHTFSLLTGNDYRRIKLFLKRAQGLL